MSVNYAMKVGQCEDRKPVVGVAVFSLTLNRRVRQAKVQISNPLPNIEVNIPPTNPNAINTNAFQLLKMRENLT